MAEKSDEEIISEVGLEASDNDISPEEALAQLSIEDDETLEPIENNTEDNETTKEEKPKENTIENEDKDDEKELINDSKDENENNEPLPIQKKQPKIYKILIGIAVFLFVILIAGAIMYFTGFFDSEPVKTPLKKIEKKVKDTINFEEKNINKPKLNRKLKMLTKTEIMNKEELEAEEKKIKEEERKKKEAEQKALEEKRKKEAQRLAKIEKEKKLLEEQQQALKKEQEDLLMLQEKLKAEFEAEKNKFLKDLENQKAQAQTPIKEEPKDIVAQKPMEEMIPNETENNTEIENDMKDKMNTNQFLSFINVATIKGDLYKSFLNRVLKIDKNVSLCRDLKNRIEIYFGPYDSENERQKIYNNLLDKGFKESYLVDFTDEEYKKRCKY